VGGTPSPDIFASTAGTTRPLTNASFEELSFTTWSATTSQLPGCQPFVKSADASHETAPGSPQSYGGEPGRSKHCKSSARQDEPLINARYINVSVLCTTYRRWSVAIALGPFTNWNMPTPLWTAI